MAEDVVPVRMTSRSRTARTRGWPWLVRQAWLGQILVLAVIVGAWYLVCGVGLVTSQTLPNPTAVAKALVDALADAEAQAALRLTVREFLTAFALGTISGAAVGIAMGLSPLLKEAYLPPLLFATSTPKVIFLPIFTMLFGIGSKSIEYFGAFEAFFYVAVTVLGAVSMVDPRHYVVARAFRASPLARLVAIVLPASAPGLVAAVWFGLKQSLLGVLIAELYASTGGLGGLITTSTQVLRTDTALALVLLISIVAVVLGEVFRSIENRLSRRSSPVRRRRRTGPRLAANGVER